MAGQTLRKEIIPNPFADPAIRNAARGLKSSLSRRLRRSPHLLYAHEKDVTHQHEIIDAALYTEYDSRLLAAL